MVDLRLPAIHSQDWGYPANQAFRDIEDDLNGRLSDTQLSNTIGAAVSPLVEAALATSGAVGVSIVTAEGVDLALSTNYGVEAGVPFYNLDGVGMDQAALLAIDPTSASGFSLVQIGA